MNIMGIAIDWKLGTQNLPDLVVLVDQLTPPDELMYHSMPVRDNGKLLWNMDPTCTLVQYLLMYPIDDSGMKLGGFGGATFERMLTTGHTVTSNNCWPSRAECLPFPCMSVKVSEQGKPGFHDMGLPHFVASLLVQKLGFHLLSRMHPTRYEWEFGISTVPEGMSKDQPRQEPPDIAIIQLNDPAELHDVIDSFMKPRDPRKSN